jgi:hypothetical protein
VDLHGAGDADPAEHEGDEGHETEEAVDDGEDLAGGFLAAFDGFETEAFRAKGVFVAGGEVLFDVEAVGEEEPCAVEREAGGYGEPGVFGETTGEEEFGGEGAHEGDLGGGRRSVPRSGSSSEPSLSLVPGAALREALRAASETKPSPARQRAHASGGSVVGVP